MADRLTLEEASTAYERSMRNVLAPGPGICEICHTFIPPAHDICIPCRDQPNHLDAVVPITYSEHYSQMHDALRGYKDGLPQVQTYATQRLMGVLWRFIEIHEPCVARAAGVDEFDVVTTVPSSMPQTDAARGNLRAMVELSTPLERRYERVLRATGTETRKRLYDTDRYRATRELEGESVLLIDDTWVSGGHAQSAGHALQAAGADVIGMVVIGRHTNPDWQVRPGITSHDLLEELPRVFDWGSCCAHPS